MNHLDSVQDDLRFVKNAVERTQRGGMPLGIAILWGLVVLVGFSLVDWRPAWAGWYWLIVGTLGFAASSVLGYAYARQTGHADRATGLRIMWHWLGMAGAIGLSLLLILSGELSSAAIGRLILLLLALTYFYAGLYFSRSLVWVSLLLAAGYIALGFISAYTWTCLGVLTCVALLAAGLAGRAHE